MAMRPGARGLFEGYQRVVWVNLNKHTHRERWGGRIKWVNLVRG